jgi:hypothetical protein
MLLSEKQFNDTFKEKMNNVTEIARNFNPDEFDEYVNANIVPELGSMHIEYIYENNKWRHVIFNTESKNIQYVVVIDLQKQIIYGHYVLNLIELYGLNIK